MNAEHNLVLFAFLLAAVPMVIGVLRRLPLAYGAYVLAALALPLSYPVAPQPLMSLPRFLLVLFPLFMWLGAWLAHRPRARLPRWGPRRCCSRSSRASSRPGTGWLELAVLPDGARAVLLDGLGTLLALAPPAPAFVGGCASSTDCGSDEAEAERAFATEIAYYRAHHHEGRDAGTLEDLRRRCAEVLRAELPRRRWRSSRSQQLTAAMLGSLRFSAYPDAPAALARCAPAA